MSQFDFQSKWNIPLEVSIENLRNDLNNLKESELSTEGLFDSIVNLFRGTYNTLRLSISAIGKPDIKPLSLDEGAINRLDKGKMSKNYVYLVDRQVDVPVGMNTKYITYSEQSYKLSEVYKNVMGLVEQLRIDLGKVISTPDGLKDSTLFSDKEYVRTQESTKKLLEEFGKMRTGTDLTATRSYSTVFGNNQELYTSIDVTRKANTNYNSVNRKKLIGAVETSMKYVQELMELTKEGYSKPLVMKIANAVSIVAEHVEGFSATTFNAQMLSVSLSSATRQVSDLM